ncbi:major histocompatibility complex class I-related gene protein-like [Pagrus major]|uniref:major histocompatibility complex class I-related gene protein-like n=1 Tax=Pagrus major TaxID=143350 RepID=UPI003CC8C1EF
MLILCHVSSPVKHTMKVFFTASHGVPNFPVVVAVMQVNDVQTGYCDSRIKTAIPSQDWMGKLRDRDPKFWKWYTGECTVHQQVFKDEFYLLKKRLNETGSVHILQRMTACEWDEETGDIYGFHQYGYNGEDFLVLHLETQTWIAPKPKAVITKHMWDRDKARNDFYKNFIYRTCLECMQKQLEYGRSSLMRTELPSVSLLQKTPSSPVSCHATGFYPHRASLVWRKDGEELHEEVDHGEILPNHDGTFQMSVDLNLSSVTPEDWTRYDCMFQLYGVKEDIITKLEKDRIRTNWVKPSDMTVPVTAAVVVLALILIGAAGLIIYKKKKDTCLQHDVMAQAAALDGRTVSRTDRPLLVSARCPPCSPDNSSELSDKLNEET